MHHFKLTVNTALFFKDRKPFPKTILICWGKKIAKPSANYFTFIITQSLQPLLIHLKKVTIKIQRLIT